MVISIKTIQRSVRAAGSAAVITTVIAGSINTFQYIRQVKNGEITVEQATVQILQNTVIAAGDSALKAGVASASVRHRCPLYARPVCRYGFQTQYGERRCCRVAVCAVDVVQNVVLYAAGKLVPKNWK